MRQAVAATVTESGQVGMRIRRDNMRGLWAELTSASTGGPTIPLRYRRLPLNSSSVNWDDLVTAAAFQGLTYQEFRAEVARLSLLPPAQRMRQPYEATPTQWQQ
jgi:hypothetical protein